MQAQLIRQATGATDTWHDRVFRFGAAPTAECSKSCKTACRDGGASSYRDARAHASAPREKALDAAGAPVGSIIRPSQLKVLPQAFHSRARASH